MKLLKTRCPICKRMVPHSWLAPCLIPVVHVLKKGVTRRSSRRAVLAECCATLYLCSRSK